MVRKGWSVMELPADGWVKVLRGRRPSSEQWPMATKNSTKVEIEKHSRGRWRQRPLVGQDKVRSLEAAPGALGPEDTCEGANSGSSQAHKGGSSASACQTPTPSRPRQSPRWNDSRKLWMHWALLEDRRTMPSRKLSTRLKRSHENDPSQNLSKSARTHRAFYHAHLKVEDGVGGRDRTVGGQSRPIDKVGSAVSDSTSSTSRLKSTTPHWLKV